MLLCSDEGVQYFLISISLVSLHRQGHSDGGKKLGEFLGWCIEAGVEMATAFAFSTENWKRDEVEVGTTNYQFVKGTLLVSAPMDQGTGVLLME